MGTIDDRTGLEILPEETCWQLLRGGTVARLAVVVGRRPDIFPVNYTVHDGAILIRTAPGTKLAASVLNRWVALEVDEADAEARTGWSVVVQGSTAEVERLDDLIEAESTALTPWAEGPRSRWLRVVPESVTGRRISGG